MGGYTKNIAVIRGLKSGFSADGGDLSGLIKAEKYGSSLKVEVSLINFAPLTEGRYVTAISDGTHKQIIENNFFEGHSDVDTGGGFAALTCFVNKQVSPVAAAICGGFRAAALDIREFIEQSERINRTEAAVPQYEDEALAQENYYEYEQTDKDGRAVRENTGEKENARNIYKNEAAAGADEGGADGIEIPLARGECFYKKMQSEIDKLLSDYPAEDGLEKVVENSRWVKISYGGGKFYVFGVIYKGETPQYLCYGVPSKNTRRPPDSLAGMASFIPASEQNADSGFWIMYQDAATGASVKAEVE